MNARGISVGSLPVPQGDGTVNAGKWIVIGVEKALAI